MDFDQLLAKYRLCPNCQQPLNIIFSETSLNQSPPITHEELFAYTQQYQLSQLQIKFACLNKLEYYFIYCLDLTNQLQSSCQLEILQSTKYTIYNTTKFFSSTHQDQTLICQDAKLVAKIDFIVWNDLYQLRQDYSDTELNFKIEKTFLLL